MEIKESREIEVTKIIATRVPPGDRWELVDYKELGIIVGLTNTLENYLKKTQYKGSYLLEPLESKISIYENSVEEVELETFDLYGEK